MTDRRTRTLVYRMTAPEQAPIEIPLVLDAETLLLQRPEGPLPEWARLENRQCSHCPLQADAHPFCPLAAALAGPIEECSACASAERVALEVETPERRICAEVSPQRALSSLFGLIMPTSGCPHLRHFRPMARFHLPLATAEETVYRATGMYLLAQYFARKRGGKFDFELMGLDAIYRLAHKTNREFARRIRHASEDSAAIRALLILDIFTIALPNAIGEMLSGLEPLFAPLAEDVDPGDA
ncbi:DUF6901 family protein [Thiohalobacter sp.]|uniref:DUF6901 family protein n=1 Tax=Thiohalobacter sp. TaxID=2025948 RepID=UPI002616D08E|nr:hypothetical protein [Thiohalobacter sp.]